MLKTRRFSLTTRVLLPVLALAFLPGCATHARPANAPSYLAKDKAVRIMPLGDSITRGSQYGNYRHPLQALLAHGGYSPQFVGESTEQSSSYHGADPEQAFTPFQPDHEGYGGFRIDQIASDSPSTDDGGVTYPGLAHALATDKPGVALLMLGTNDVKPFADGLVDPGGPGYDGKTGFAADARLDARACHGYPARQSRQRSVGGGL